VCPPLSCACPNSSTSARRSVRKRALRRGNRARLRRLGNGSPPCGCRSRRRIQKPLVQAPGPPSQQGVPELHQREPCRLGFGIARPSDSCPRLRGSCLSQPAYPSLPRSRISVCPAEDERTGIVDTTTMGTATPMRPGGGGTGYRAKTTDRVQSVRVNPFRHSWMARCPRLNRRCYERERGSRASRRPSPTRLKARTASRSARPGPREYQGTVVR
jgi:hypothetical protein